MDIFGNCTLPAIALKMQKEGSLFFQKAGRFLLDLRLVLLKIFLTVAGTVFVPSLLAYYIFCFFILAYFNLILLFPMMIVRNLRIKFGYPQALRNIDGNRISPYKLSTNGELTEQNVDPDANTANTSSDNNNSRVEDITDYSNDMNTELRDKYGG